MHPPASPEGEADPPASPCLPARASQWQAGSHGGRGGGQAC